MRTRIVSAVVAFAFLILAPAITRAQSIVIAGDSISNEYRGTNNTCGSTSYASTTLNWMEALVAKRSINVGSWGAYGGLRGTGYAQNWAVNGHDSHDAYLNQASPASEQHPDVAILMVGGMDLEPNTHQRAREIYYGTISPSAYTSWKNGILNDQRSALQLMTQYGGTRFLTTLPTPVASVNYSDPTGIARLVTAQQDVNALLAANASTYNYTVIDLEQWWSGLSTAGYLQSNGSIVVGSHTIATTSGCEPHNQSVPSGLPGTVVSGLLANYILSVTGLATSLTDTAILSAAGL